MSGIFYLYYLFTFSCLYSIIIFLFLSVLVSALKYMSALSKIVTTLHIRACVQDSFATVSKTLKPRPRYFGHGLINSTLMQRFLHSLPHFLYQIKVVHTVYKSVQEISSEVLKYHYVTVQFEWRLYIFFLIKKISMI